MGSPKRSLLEKNQISVIFLSLSKGFTDEDTELSTSQIKILLKLIGTGNNSVQSLNLG